LIQFHSAPTAAVALHSRANLISESISVAHRKKWNTNTVVPLRLPRETGKYALAKFTAMVANNRDITALVSSYGYRDLARVAYPCLNVSQPKQTSPLKPRSIMDSIIFPRLLARIFIAVHQRKNTK
jgi:hypothetical protein